MTSRIDPGSRTSVSCLGFTHTLGMADQDALAGLTVGEGGEDSDVSSAVGLRSTADNNLVILLNGEMVFGKKDGARPRPTPHVLAGSIVPRRPLAASPAIVAGKGVREATRSMANAPDDTMGSEIFDQSSLETPGEDLSYEHARPISPIGDASMGSMQQLAREIDMMEGSYFSTQGQRPVRQPETTDSILSARGMARIKDISSSDDEDDEIPTRYALSKPYRANVLKEDWVKAWGEAWGLRVNKAEEQKRENRLNALQDKRQKDHRMGSTSTHLANPGRSSPDMKRAVQGDGPSVLRVTKTSLSKAAADAVGSPPPPGPKSPWADRTMQWGASEDSNKTPQQQASLDESMASAEKTATKSKWLFGDAELTEDEEDVKLGEENQDGNEPWTRSARKQHSSLERSRQMLQVQLKADGVGRASSMTERKQKNPHTIRKHAMSARERALESGDDADSFGSGTIFTYTPDVAKLRLAREKHRAGQPDDEGEYRPLFRRADGRLVRKLHPVATSVNESVAPPTMIEMPSERVGAWV